MEQTFAWFRFGFSCSGCGESVMIWPEIRTAKTACRTFGMLHGPWRMKPAKSEVPDSTCDMTDLIWFTDLYDIRPHFQNLWGTEYDEKLRNLQEACNIAFENNTQEFIGWPELFLILRKEILIGPYVFNNN